MRPVVTVVVACLLLSAGVQAVPANDVVLTDASVRITEVIYDRTPDDPVATVPLGRRVIVAGVTNLQPDENLILVEARRVGGDVVAVEGTSTWGRTGEWVVDFDPGTLPPGEYVLRAEAAGASDVVELRIVASTPTERPTATPTPTPVSTATPTLTPTPTVAPIPTPTPTSTPAPTDGSGPGVGVVPALVALGVATALAVRMNRS